jgi:hypothetical protein
VGVDAHDHLVDVGNAIHEIPNPLAVLPRNRISHRVGDINRRGPRLDGCLHHQAKEVLIGPAGILTGKLDVVRIPSGPLHGPDGGLKYLLPAHLQFMPHVNIGRGNEGVDPRALRVLERFPCPIDVLLSGPAESRNGNPIPDILRNHLDGLKIIRRCDWETCLDNIDPKPGELSSELQLLTGIHAVSRRLLSIAQCGIKD